MCKGHQNMFSSVMNINIIIVYLKGKITKSRNHPMNLKKWRKHHEMHGITHTRARPYTPLHPPVCTKGSSLWGNYGGGEGSISRPPQGSLRNLTSSHEPQCRRSGPPSRRDERFVIQRSGSWQGFEKSVATNTDPKTHESTISKVSIFPLYVPTGKYL